ncbi:MAG: hypothetical protein GYB65_18695 [Chloroflexi bacterium]|nr:hypothetical protein [Chloroflexota bacterium]
MSKRALISVIGLVVLASVWPLVVVSGQGDGQMIDGFETGAFADRWWGYTDSGAWLDCVPGGPGFASDTALLMEFALGVDVYGGCGTEFEVAQDWSAGESLSFDWRADTPGLIVGVLLTSENTTFGVYLETGTDWQTITLPWDSFTREEWDEGGTLNVLDPARITALDFAVGHWEMQQTGSVWIDNLRLSGGPTTAAPAPDTAPDSAAGGWRPAGFGAAGNFIGVAFDPNQPGVVYATSDVAGVLRSADGGQTWEVRSAGLGNYQVSAIAVDPFDSNTLYAGTGGFTGTSHAGMYVSTDAGRTWSHLASTAANNITYRRFRTAQVIAPDPTQPGVILTGSRQNGIWRSIDSGQTWSQVLGAPLSDTPPQVFGDELLNDEDDPAGPPYPAPTSSVVFAPDDAHTVYAGFDGAGVFKSSDGGQTWAPVSFGLPDAAPVKGVAVGNGGVVYAAVGSWGVYRSTDGGASWVRANTGLEALLPDHWITSVTVQPDAPDTAYATVFSYDYPNVWRTTDGGQNWSSAWDMASITPDLVYDPAGIFDAGVYPTLTWQLAIDPFDPQHLAVVNLWAIYTSRDGGNSWQETVQGAQNTCVNNVTVGDDGVWYATHWDAGILSSADQGATWTLLSPPHSLDYYGQVDPVSGHYWGLERVTVGGTLYTFTTVDPWSYDHSLVLRSTDGVNWEEVLRLDRPDGEWLGGVMLGLAADPSQPGTLYVAQDGGQVYVTTDNGFTWAPTAGQPGDNSFSYALDVDSAGRIFAGTVNDGLWRSVDGGASWELVYPDTVFRVLATDSAVYVPAGDGNLYRSTDGGDTWARLTDLAPADQGDGVPLQGFAVAVDPTDPDHIVFGLRDTWHAADAGGGVLESFDGGATWTPANEGLGQLSVSTLTFTPDGGLIAGTSCAGIWFRPAQ